MSEMNFSDFENWTREWLSSLDPQRDLWDDIITSDKEVAEFYTLTKHDSLLNWLKDKQKFKADRA